MKLSVKKRAAIIPEKGNYQNRQDQIYFMQIVDTIY